MKISIVGGNGPLGGLFKRFFEGHGYLVQPLGRKDGPFYKERLEGSDVVIISVPISVTKQVIRTIGPLVHPDSLLMDMTSLKGFPVRTMLDAFKGEVVGTHPLFGPPLETLEGQTIVITPGRGEKWLHWLKETFTKSAITVTMSTPEEHDRFMAFTQCMRTLNTMMLGKVIRENKVNPKKLMGYATPIFKSEMWWLGRLFSQDPDLYASIHMDNETAVKVLDDYLSAGKALVDIITRKDKEAFLQFFKDSVEYFEEIREEAQTRSDKMIEEIVRP